MNTSLLFPGTCFLSVAILATGTLFAQQDKNKKAIDITSSFRPVLRNAVKINFNASPPPAGSNIPRLDYDIPAQNLVFNYNPVTLRPLSLKIDSIGEGRNSNYVKAGFGNYRTPYVDAGFTFGDGKKTVVNLLANHISSKGKIPFQEYGNTKFQLNGNFVQNKIEWYGKAGYSLNTYYRYAADSDFVNPTKSNLRQRFQAYSVQAGFKNAFVTRYRITYNPDVKIDVFTDNHDATESNAVLNIPIEKSIGKSFGFKVAGNFDFTHYKPASGSSETNNVIIIDPALLLKTPNVYLQLGVKPSWNNTRFNVLPDILVNYNMNEGKFVLQAGFIGRYIKNTYQYLAGMNPWISQLDSQFNTVVRERYAGFRGTVGDHFNYNIKVGFVKYTSLALLVNSQETIKNFEVRKDEEVRSLNGHGELGFIVQDKFNLNVALDYNNYYDLKTENEAWHLIPLQLNAALRWHPVKDVWFKSDAFIWSGPTYLDTKTGKAHTLKGAFDLNAGIEFRVADRVSVWGQVNNIFNNKFQRWYGYESLGLNILGGVRITFDQKPQ